MTPSEFAAARKTLGLTQEEMASELGLTPHVIAGMENGEARVPKSIAQDLEVRVAFAHRDALLKASGLPECPVMLGLERSLDGKTGEGLVKASEELIAHAESCPACNARAEYIQKHGPPIPDLPIPTWIRVVETMERLLGRLPQPLHPAKGKAGEGRRMGAWMAAIFSMIAIAVALFGAVAGLATHGFSSRWWQQPLGIAATVPLGYFLGGFLGGTVYDLTRPLAHRFVGYVLRGGLIVPAIYGSIGVVLPFVADDVPWSAWPVLTLAFGIMGAFGGVLLWLIHRVTGKLPASAS